MVSAKTVVARYRVDRGENLRDLDGPTPSLPRGARLFTEQEVRLAARFHPGDKVRIRTSHKFKHYHGDVGEIEKIIPINKAYVELEKNGRVIVDLDDVEHVEVRSAFQVQTSTEDLKLPQSSQLSRKIYERFYRAMDHATQDAKRKYLQEHPDADKSKQRVKPGIHSEKAAAVEADAKEAAFEFLRRSRLSDLSLGMAKAAREAGETPFGMRDVSMVLRAWFDNKEPSSKKIEVGFEYLKSPAGRKLFDGITKGVETALKKSGGRVGYKDVGEVVLAFAEDK